MDDFVGHATGVVGRSGGVADFEGEAAVLTVVGLSGGVVRGVGVDAPGADAQGGEVCDGAFVVGCYLSISNTFVNVSGANLRLDRRDVRKQVFIGLPRNDGVNADVIPIIACQCCPKRLKGLEYS